GIERRLYTAGEHKAILDPFLPERPDDVERLKSVQREAHEGFIALVKENRGARLKGQEKTLFSGEFWAGHKAIELGLADAIGDLRSPWRGRSVVAVCPPVTAPARGGLGRSPPGVREPFGRPADLAEQVISALEARALWARYGL